MDHACVPVVSLQLIGWKANKSSGYGVAITAGIQCGWPRQSNRSNSWSLTGTSRPISHLKKRRCEVSLTTAPSFSIHYIYYYRFQLVDLCSLYEFYGNANLVYSAPSIGQPSLSPFPCTSRTRSATNVSLRTCQDSEKQEATTVGTLAIVDGGNR